MREQIRTIALVVAALALVVIAASIVANERTKAVRNAFLHEAWNAAPIMETLMDQEGRKELYASEQSPVLAYGRESETGRQLRTLFVRFNDGSEALLSTQTVNMWGYSSYGWEDWCRGCSEDEFQRALGVVGAWFKTKS